jgi:hypothetical protein
VLNLNFWQPERIQHLITQAARDSETSESLGRFGAKGRLLDRKLGIALATEFETQADATKRKLLNFLAL